MFQNTPCSNCHGDQRWGRDSLSVWWVGLVLYHRRVDFTWVHIHPADVIERVDVSFLKEKKKAKKSKWKGHGECGLVEEALAWHVQGPGFSCQDHPNRNHVILCSWNGPRPQSGCRFLQGILFFRKKKSWNPTEFSVAQEVEKARRFKEVPLRRT